MNELKVENDGDIDLVEIFQVLWNSKFTIIGFITACVFFVFIYFQSQPRYFNSYIEIKPIASYEHDKYIANNSMGFFPIGIIDLIELYVEQIEEKKIIQQAIVKNKLIEKKEYDNEKDYSDAVVSLAASFDVIKTNFEADNKQDNTETTNWKINFQYYDAQVLKVTLATINELANNQVREVLVDRFNLKMNDERTDRIAIIEDLELQMKFAKDDYDTDIASRLAFLKEQAIIARKLDISKGNIENLSIETEEKSLTIQGLELPFYSRGYIAIETEIGLIKERVKKDLFINKLSQLKKQKRALEINKDFVRAEILFNESPIMNLNSFLAASLKVEEIEIVPLNNHLIPLAWTASISSIVIVFHILIWNAIRARRDYS